MQYEELVKILQSKYEIRPVTAGNHMTIKEIRLLNQDISDWDEHTLYIGEFAHIRKMPDKPIMLFCTDDSSFMLPKGSNCCYIFREDMYSLFNMAQSLIYTNLRAEGELLKLARIAIETKNPAQVINAAAVIMGNALILVDTNMQVILWSKNYAIADPLWAENVDKGHYSDEFIQKLRSNKQLRDWSKWASETQFITLPGDKQRKLVARITRENHLVGALIMIEHHTSINDIHIQQLPLVGEILFDTFDLDTTSEHFRESFYSAMLNNLLDDKDVSESLDTLTTFREYLPEIMHVVVVRFIHPVHNRYLKQFINMELKQIFASAYTLRHKGYIAILVSNISPKQKEELSRLARNEEIVIGFSWPFSDITQFKRYFNQAVAAVKYSQYLEKTCSVISYTDISYYDLLQNYSGQVPLENFCHPALRILRKYDDDNHTELYVTLRTYLECNKNLQATAKSLFIHRNSLAYRIARIKQLTGINYDDVNLINSLMDSFRIEHYLNSVR